MTSRPGQAQVTRPETAGTADGRELSTAGARLTDPCAPCLTGRHEWCIGKTFCRCACERKIPRPEAVW